MSTAEVQLARWHGTARAVAPARSATRPLQAPRLRRETPSHAPTGPHADAHVWELLNACRQHPVHDWAAAKAVKQLLQEWEQRPPAEASAAVQLSWSWFCRRRLALHPTLPWTKTLIRLKKDERQAAVGRGELSDWRGCSRVLAFGHRAPLRCLPTPHPPHPPCTGGLT